MGRRGPLPKRSDEHQHPETLRRKQVAGLRPTLVAGRVTVPDADPEWHPIARMIWEAALESPAQERFYEATDWAVLYNLCDDVSYFKNRDSRSGQMMASINTQMLNLLLTEGDRRRVQVELQRATEEQLESPGVQALKEWAERRKAQ